MINRWSGIYKVLACGSPVMLPFYNSVLLTLMSKFSFLQSQIH